MSLTPFVNHDHARTEPTTAPLDEVSGAAPAAMLRLHLAGHGHEACLLTAVGEIDLATSPALKDTIRDVLAGESRYLVIDMGSVTFLDSTGLAVLIWAHQRLNARSGGLTLVRPTAVCMRVLEITQLTAVFSFAPSVKHAFSRLPEDGRLADERQQHNR